MEGNSKNILDLPNEVLELIFDNLSYTEVAQARPTCKQVNYICCNLMSRPLHGFSKILERTLNGFERAVWFKKENLSSLEYVNRLRKGAHSLLQLSVIVKTADAATCHFIRDGTLPPLSADLLARVESAVKFATHKNPLVGQGRMRNILKDFLLYYEENLWTTATSSLNASATFQTILQLLETFPKQTEIVKNTSFGLEYELSCVNPIIDSEDTGFWAMNADAKTVIINLVNMRLRTTSMLLQKSFDESPTDTFMHTVMSSRSLPDMILSKALVKVWCGKEETEFVTSPQHLLHTRPDKFTVEIFGRSLTHPHDASATQILLSYTDTNTGSGRNLFFYWV